MKKLRIIMLIGMVCFTSLCALAQKKVPHGFQYQADVSEEGILKEVTQVAYPGTSSIRLFFEEVQLGPNSYLLLEGSDGAQQRLDVEALKNWRNSSAYFNGGQVKVSVYQAPGDSVTFKIEDLRVNERQTSLAARRTAQSGKTATQATSGARIGEFNPEEMPYAAAVGRFTNGSNSFGTGWIAPNGAIVTNYTVFGRVEEGYDIIEFNAPPSNSDGSVNHPAPEDQYPIRPIVNGEYGLNTKISGFDFKKSTGYLAVNEGLGINHYSASWAIVEALPNSTGLRPGEHQQQYFRVASNPGSFAIESMEKVEVDILHYGNYPEDLVFPENSRTLRVTTTELLAAKKYMTAYSSFKDQGLIYRDKGDIPFSSAMGAPITYYKSNVAIGVHHTFYFHAPAIAYGFEHDELRNRLNDFFTSNVVYVDAEGLYGNSATGEIHKPYIQIADGVGQAADDAIVYIAKGSYDESLTIDRPMTLKAPVGVVKIGTSEGSNSRTGQTTLPSGLFSDRGESVDTDFEGETVEMGSFLSYPNPFSESTELRYSLAEDTPVIVKVFDFLGNELNTLVETRQPAGAHAVVWDGRNNQGKLVKTGVYIIQLQMGIKVDAVRIIKK